MAPVCQSCGLGRSGAGRLPVSPVQFGRSGAGLACKTARDLALVIKSGLCPGWLPEHVRALAIKSGSGMWAEGWALEASLCPFVQGWALVCQLWLCRTGCGLAGRFAALFFAMQVSL